jgi:steroid 5-alpha reductase family enzyme
MPWLAWLARPSLRASVVVAAGLQAAAWAVSTVGRPEPTEHYYDLAGAATHVALVAHAVGTSAWASGGRVSPRVALMAALSTVWAVRLGSYLYGRVVRVGADTRFTELKARPATWALPWAFQAVWCVALQAPLVIAARTGAAARLRPRDAVGACVFLGGLALEWVADAQKDAFKRRHPTAPMTQGVFAYSVYPNYAGECTLWWGQLLLAAPAATQPWMLAAAALAPVFDTLLIWRVSGIPLAERAAWRKYGSDPAYLDYRARTSRFVPWPPRATASPDDLARVLARAEAAAAARP